MPAELFTPLEENLARTFSTAVRSRLAVGDRLRPGKDVVLTREVGDEKLSIVVDKQVLAIWKGAQNGAATELIDLGLGGAVVELFNLENER